ncbi:unnamed protein product [Trichobilharzia regenti]|nr:unnamed protein product [Trichobilharzia regenti]
MCLHFPFISDAIVNKYPKLTEIVNRFNQLLSREVENHDEQLSQSLWLSLASLEREVLQSLEGKKNCNTTTSGSSHSRSLLSYLAEAINEDESSVIPLPLSMATRFKQEKSHDDSEKIGTSPEELSSTTSKDIDPSLVFDFIQKLTCISSRSKEELCKLVCDNLNIVHSSKLDQFIDSILSQLTDSNEGNQMKPLVYHSYICSLLSYFLVCGQFNLIAIRILPIGGGPLLRLTAHPSMHDLTDALDNWQFTHASYTIRSIGDYLIGTAIRINQLTIEQVCSTLKNQFINASSRDDGANDAWVYFVYSLLMNLPFSLFGLVFSSNNNNSTDSQLNRNYLISAIGSIGYQLQWPAYIRFFEENRFKLIDRNGDNKMQNIEASSSQPVTITVYPSPMEQTESISHKEAVDNSENSAIDRDSCVKSTEMNKVSIQQIYPSIYLFMLVSLSQFS